MQIKKLKKENKLKGDKIMISKSVKEEIMNLKQPDVDLTTLRSTFVKSKKKKKLIPALDIANGNRSRNSNINPQVNNNSNMMEGLNDDLSNNVRNSFNITTNIISRSNSGKKTRR